MQRSELELLRGTLDVLILKTLSWGPAHGYAVASWIEQVTADALRVEEGSLYPALHRLERRGLVEAEWGLSENNRRAKFYRLTEAGRQQLQADATRWGRFAEAVAKVLGGNDRPAWARGA
jgi:PadR family transcriptional regulator, regulatory protein PadR